MLDTVVGWLFCVFSSDGKIDVEEATEARIKTSGIFAFCRDPELWIGSSQYLKVYRNFQVRVLLCLTFVVYGEFVCVCRLVACVCVAARSTQSSSVCV